jgi:acetolactate synthase-1/2/3 large subunit
MTAAEYIAERLVAAGVSHVFGVGGANIEDLFAAVQRRRPRLRAVLGKHEHGAGTAADAYARVRGGLGVVMTTSGGGALNLVHALGEAHASRVPLLAIVGEPPSDLQGRGAFQDTSGQAGAVDALQVFRGVTVCAVRIEHAADLPAVLEQAIDAALTRSGPAVLLVAKDRQVADIGTVAPPTTPRPRVAPAPDRPAVSRAANALRGRPVLLIAGPEVAREGAQAELARLTDRLQATVAVAPDARDAFDNRDPRFAGVAGAMGHPEVNRALGEAAVVLLAGTRLPVLARMGLDRMLAEKELVSVGIEEPFAGGRSLVRLTGPTRGGLVALTEALPSGAPPTPRASAPIAAQPVADGLLRAQAVVAAVERALPDGAVVLVDAGNTGAFVAHHLRAPRDGRWLLAMGMAGMGWSFGAAVGAACASGRRCVVLAGDGAFFMHGLEIHTALEHALPITYVLFDNRAHGMCVVREQLLLRDDGGYNRFAPSQLAAGLGAMFPRLPTFQCADAAALEAALPRAFAHAGPAVIAAELSEVEVPPFVAFQAALAGGRR